ncbi:hypothetical protein H632_c4362p0, partial [Helicosporidium sp. ATCC 50920]
FYYVCFENGTSSYSECETPNLFNDEIQDCDDVFNFEYSNISKFPKYVSHLLLSSMRPDATYSGGVTFKGTGLDFKSDAAVIKGAIALLKEKNPNTKVLVSVGGFDYDNWDGLNASAVANFVRDFGLDGVDVDYEPSTADCKLVEEKMQCSTDSEYVNAIKALRVALPRPYILSNAVLHVGAF